MVFVSSVSPERRANLRRLRAEFEAAFDAMHGDLNPTNPAFHAADARYRAWIKAMDAVALALLDDIDACEASAQDRTQVADLIFAPAGPYPATAEVDRLFSGIDDLRQSVDLIGTAPARAPAPRRASAKTRAMNVVGQDRVARHWNLTLDDDVGLRR